MFWILYIAYHIRVNCREVIQKLLLVYTYRLLYVAKFHQHLLHVKIGGSENAE